jgi:putative transposase
VVSLKAKRTALQSMRSKFNSLSIRSACKILGLHQSTFFYKPDKLRDDEQLKAKIIELADKRPKDGRPSIIWRLRERHGFTDNHKRIARVYRELGLQVGKRTRRRKRVERRFMFIAPTKPNEIWAMDFVMDSFASGRRFRILTVKDLFTHEAVLLFVDSSITGACVARELDRLKLTRGLPKTIICDNGTEFVSKAMDQWAFRNSIELSFIQPGKPIQNAFIESFNGKLRATCLEENWFMDLQHARQVIEEWRIEYNTDRPNKPLGKLTPAEFAKLHGVVV